MADESHVLRKQYNIRTADDMRELGRYIATFLRGGDVVVLSGPLGAGKTTFTQGIGQGMHVAEPVVSPTFTIAREHKGEFSNSGGAARLVHVDAYRLPGSDNDDLMADPSYGVHRLLDELESLGLDEILDEVSNDTVILMEWGSMMASVLSDSRLEIFIDRSSGHEYYDAMNLTSDGMRVVTVTAVGQSWQDRLTQLRPDFLENDN